MNIPEEQRKLIKAIEETKDVNKLCEYLNNNYPKNLNADGLDIKSFVVIDNQICEVATFDHAGDNNFYKRNHIKRYTTHVFKGICLDALEFSGSSDDVFLKYVKRYRTKDEAIAGHDYILKNIVDFLTWRSNINLAV